MKRARQAEREISSEGNGGSTRHAAAILRKLYRHRNPRAVESMARYGITANRAYGLSAPVLHGIARSIGKNHDLALKLWKTGIHDARILAALIDEPDRVTERQMEAWVKDFGNWAICDGCCLHLFDKTRFAWMKAIEWSGRNEEFIKRAGFTMMATLAVHDKERDDRAFLRLFGIIERSADDDRKYVMKSINWALRQIGKRSIFLHHHAVATAVKIAGKGNAPARWIASDALRELRSDAVIKRMQQREARRR